MDTSITIRLADAGDMAALIAAGVELFDFAVKPDRAAEFFADPRHHLVVALAGARVVGMASGFHYVHPDKDPTMFVNEVGVVEGRRNQGIARALVRFLSGHARAIGCTQAWIATEASNHPARRAFIAAGGRESPEPVTLIELPLEDDKPAVS